ncbi:MAG: DUF423 domain-containing protein [Trueperaceae bacterium]|nr:MAG: DUF423 domain-containing protein [Trueperaceae bacterium]
MARPLLALSALWGAAGVALGAFGAHALDGLLRPERLATFETAVQYHLIHALAAGLAASLGTRVRGAPLAATLLLAGSAVFAGSLYALVATDIGAFGAVAPVGGTAMIAGWLALAWGAWRSHATGA